MICLVLFFHHVCIYEKSKPGTIVPPFFFFLKKSDHIGFGGGGGGAGSTGPSFSRCELQRDGSGPKRDSRLGVRKCVFGSHLQIFSLL